MIQKDIEKIIKDKCKLTPRTMKWVLKDNQELRELTLELDTYIHKLIIEAKIKENGRIYWDAEELQWIGKTEKKLLKTYQSLRETELKEQLKG